MCLHNIRHSLEMVCATFLLCSVEVFLSFAAIWAYILVLFLFSPRVLPSTSGIVLASATVRSQQDEKKLHHSTVSSFYQSSLYLPNKPHLYDWKDLKNSNAYWIKFNLFCPEFETIFYVTLKRFNGSNRRKNDKGFPELQSGLINALSQCWVNICVNSSLPSIH